MSELAEARAALEAFCSDNDLDIEKAEFTLSYNVGADHLEATTAVLLIALEEAMEDTWWHLEIWDEEDTRTVIVRIEYVEGGAWEVIYAYGRDQKKEGDEE